MRRGRFPATLGAACLTVGALGAYAAAGPTTQSSTGHCSPNISDVGGNVVLQLRCEGISEVAVKQINSRLRKLEVSEKSLHAAYAEVSRSVESSLAKNPQALKQIGIGSLLFMVGDNLRRDPSYPALIQMSVALTAAQLVPNTDVTALSADAQDALRNFVVKTRAIGRPLMYHVEGHAGSGTAQYAMKYSERLAASIKRYLVVHGVNEECIVTEAFGRLRPIVPEEAGGDKAALSEANAAVNTRAVVRFEGVGPQGCRFR